MFNRFNTRIAPVLAAATLAAMTAQSALAAPLVLPPAPLFLSTIVDPNVFITLDDSGSMDWGPMVKEGLGKVVDAAGNVAIPGITTDNGLPYIAGLRRGYYSPGVPRLYTSRYNLPPADGTDPEWDKAWIIRNHFGNVNYYNPSVEYKPWPGTKANGDPMYELITDPKVTPIDPDDFDPSDPDTYIDLTADHSFSENGKTSTVYIPTYFVWEDNIKIPYVKAGLNQGDLIDVNKDGIIDSDDGDPATPNDVIELDDGRRRVKITDAKELQNFANWYAYYRSRINVTKSVLGGVINRTDASRVGIRLFNVAANLADVAEMSEPDNKRSLLDALYEKNIGLAGTPARRALFNTGAYFAQTTGNGGPILSKADGGECQQNFNITMSDGFWNNKYPPTVNNTDGDNADKPSDAPFNGLEIKPGFDGDTYADSYSNTLADVSMMLYETDLRGDLADLVPSIEDVDEATHQHLVNFTVAFGINGTLDPDIGPTHDDFPGWPEPVRNTETTVDDMWHAAYNGRGEFLNAQNPAELESTLSSAINTISERTGTAAAVAVNSAQLSLESVIYLAQFNSNRWQGNLLAFPIIDTNTGELSAAPKWDAASLLNSRNLGYDPSNAAPVNSRTVISYNKDIKASVAFDWASISMDMKDDLKTSPSGGVDSDAIAEERLHFLRGDRSNEGTGLQFRQRLSRLGDMVNSGPVFVGKPSLNWPDFAPFPEGTEAYSNFKNGPAANREAIVYIGSNDSMLHAFADKDGEEIFAYVPGLFASTAPKDGLHYLTEGNYGHKFYVDQTPAISDVYISSGGSKEWHTVLINGLRSGGRGIFALNVTDPNNFTEAKAGKVALWEFSSDDDPDLGYTFSQPFIAMTNDGKWKAIFGNGYNDLGSGQSTLFIVDIEGGTDGSWDGLDVIKISTGVGSAADPNGLATPALADLDGNGTVDRVYGGDRRGNMWAFDLSSDNPNQWNVAYRSGSTNLPIFTTPADQPITAKPVLAKHPTQPDSSSPSNAPNIMVYFGTGQYLVKSDTSSVTQQSFYGVWDQGDDSRDRSHLVEQTFDGSFGVRVLTRNQVDYSIHWGWYFDLPIAGERAVTAPIARADTVFFNSFVPVEDPCSIGGFGFRFGVDMATGGSPLEASFDVNEDGVIDESDYVSNGVKTSTQVAVRQEGYLPEPVFIEDLAFTADEAIKVKALKDIPTGRFSWQELIQ